MFEHPTRRALLDTITSPGFSVYDQWEAQLLAIIAGSGTQGEDGAEAVRDRGSDVSRERVISMLAEIGKASGKPGGAIGRRSRSLHGSRSRGRR